MRLKKALAISLIGTTLFAHANKADTVSSDKNAQYDAEKWNIPKPILKFTSLDFDGRMALKETMCQQNKTRDFSQVIADTLYQTRSTAFTLENYKKCWEIVQAGHPFDSLNPQKCSVVEMAELCGFKRLHAFLKFYQKKENQQKSFLANKDKSYISAFMAEEKIFNDVLELYDFKTRSETWQKFNIQINEYLNKCNDPALKDLYWQNLKKQIKSKFLAQKKLKTR